MSNYAQEVLGLLAKLDAPERKSRRRLLEVFYTRNKDVIEPLIDGYLARGAKIALWGPGSVREDGLDTVFFDVFDPDATKFSCICRKDPAPRQDDTDRYPIKGLESAGVDAVFELGSATYDRRKWLKDNRIDVELVSVNDAIWGKGYAEGRGVVSLEASGQGSLPHDERNYDKGSVCSLTIFYQATLAEVENVRSYAHQVGKAFVFDNSPDPDPAVTQALSAIENVELIASDGVNHGLCVPINRALEQARLQGFSWLVTFDQDSFAADDMIEEMLDFAQSPECPRSVALLAPTVHKRKEPFDCEVSLPKVSYLSHAIQSGLMHRIEAVDEIGQYDERLFIDEVDNEYCARAHAKGFFVVRVNDALLYHQICDTNGKKEINKYSPLRFFYRTRNMLHIIDEYAESNPGYAVDTLAGLMKENLFIARDRNAAEKGLAMMLGYWHYRHGLWVTYEEALAELAGQGDLDGAMGASTRSLL